MRWRMLFAVPLLLLAAACANGPESLTPQQEAVALNDTYQAVARPALKCVESPACEEKAGEAIRAADTVAFGYVEEVSTAAIAYDNAPEDQKPAKLTAFDRILLAGKGAVAAFSTSLTKLLNF